MCPCLKRTFFDSRENFMVNVKKTPVGICLDGHIFAP